MRQVCHFLCALLVVIVCREVAGAVEAAGTEADIASIRSAASDYVAASRRGDFHDLEKLWSPDGNYVNAAGQLIKIEELSSAQSAASFSLPMYDELASEESTLRFVCPDVAIEDGYGEAGENAKPIRFTAVWVKHDGEWLLDSLREVLSSPEQKGEPLQSLKWLIGEWTGQTDNAVVLVSSHWSDGDKYIIRDFVVHSEGGAQTGGTQRIGWDAAKGQIKCWTFDSQGGSGEGTWQRDGKSWVVESQETLANGAVSSTSAVYTPMGEGRFVWEVKSAKVGDADLPLQRIEFTRATND